ncbi:hypothetical protein JKF63_07648 [Porcisia hertigi]|uniref:Uncharacterized protein n=1 Tax=Porcisia hertigi TaxID=2761500 RepID=A0A836LHG2_9TRYP|nr:hypothetical protein JKF63_07648 [Porcisia hertigi]
MTCSSRRLDHVTEPSSEGSSSRGHGKRALHMPYAAEAAAADGAGVFQGEQKNFKGTPGAVLHTPPPPNGWRQATAVPSSSSTTTSLDSIYDRAGNSENNRSSSHSSHLASHTSSHYLFAIQRDLEAIVSLQRLQLQERRVPMPSQASTTENAPRAWTGGGQMFDSPSATVAQHHIPTADNADPLMHLHSIDHAKKKWLEGEYLPPPALPQQQSLKSLSPSLHAPLAPEPAGARDANASDTAPQLSIEPSQLGLQGAEDTSLSLAPQDASGASIPAMHHRQLDPQPPPPPPSTSPIPASLVEYQRYLMQLEHQQRQHREVLRRHRKQRKKEKIASAQRGAASTPTLAYTTTTPPRQRVGVGGVVAVDRRDRSPPLAMMMQAIRQRRGGDGDGETSTSDTSKTASSAAPLRDRHWQKRSHSLTVSPPAATIALSRPCSAGKRASIQHGSGRSAQGAGPSAARVAGAPAAALMDEPLHSQNRQRLSQAQRWQDTDLQGSATNRRSKLLNQQMLAAAVVKGQESQHQPPHPTRLVVGSPRRSAALEPASTDAMPPHGCADATRPRSLKSSSPVEAFADALLLDTGGALGTVIGDTSTAAPASVALSTTTGGAAVMLPCEVSNGWLSGAEMTPAAAAEPKVQYHVSREQQKAMRRVVSPISPATTTPTPAFSTELLPSHEKGPHAVRAEGGAGMCVEGGGTTPAVTSTSADITAVLRHPGASVSAYSRHQHRSRSAEPILAHSNDGLHWRVTRHRSRGAVATIPPVDAHPSHPDPHDAHRYHHHHHRRRHHRSMEGISSTIPEHGTGTPRSSRYRYNSSSNTTRQRKQRRQLSKHSPCRASGVETGGGDRGGGIIKHTVGDVRLRSGSRGTHNRAQQRAPSPKSHPDRAINDTGARSSPQKGGGAVARRANLHHPPASRSAAAVWRDVKLMWAPAPASHTPFAAVYRYRPLPWPPTSSRAQQQQQQPAHEDAPSSAMVKAADKSPRGHPTGRSSDAAVMGTVASRALARTEGATHSALSPSPAIIPHTLPQKTSAGAPLLCMADSLIGAALRDVVPVCRARQREVAREVARRRYQLISTGVGGTASSARVY